MVRPASLLTRNSFVDTPCMSSLQAQADSLIGRFVEEATNPTTLAAMMVGGMAYRVGRIGTLALWEGHVAATPLRLVSYGIGLGSEVTAFEFTNRTLNMIAGDHIGSPLQNQANLWSWSGPGGWAQGLSSSLISFGLLRGAGFLSREQNLVFQHLFQSSAMVAGHNMAGALGLAPRPGGSLVQQWVEAESMNLALGAGMTLVHGAFPHWAALERSFDLSLQSQSNGLNRSWTQGGRRLVFATDMIEEPARSESPQGAHPWERPTLVLMSGISGEPVGGGKAPQPEIMNHLSALMDENKTANDTTLDVVAEHFSLDRENFKEWITEIRHLSQSVGRDELPEQSTQSVYDVLKGSQNHPETLKDLLHFFLYTSSDYQEPHRDLQTFSETLSLGLGAVRLYQRLGASMNASHPRPFARTPVGDGYFLQISPGEGEAAGGLHFTLLREEGNSLLEGGTPLAEVGLMLGLTKAQVVFVQGEKGHYSAHVNRLRALLGGDPFDWLLNGTMAWARSEGIETFQAYSHTHNYWLKNRLAKMGDSHEANAYRAHLTRLYDTRFLRLGLKPHPEIPELFERSLSTEIDSFTPPHKSSVLPDLMKQILAPRENHVGSSDLVFVHLSRLIDQAIGAPDRSFDVLRLEKGREILTKALQIPGHWRLVQEHLFSLEETYPPSSLTDYVFTIGDQALRGKSFKETLEHLSQRLNEGGTIHSFYRGLSRVELQVWQIAHVVAGRNSNSEKMHQVTEIAEVLRKNPWYTDMSQMVDQLLVRLRGEDPSSLRVSQPTFSQMTDLFRERSMEHMFFSRQPSEAAQDFARIGGILLRMDLPKRLLLTMRPQLGHHVAFAKNPKNLSLLIHHYHPSRIYEGEEGLQRALKENEALSSVGSEADGWPTLEAPLYVSTHFKALMEAAFRHPPARHLLNQIPITRALGQIFQAYREGRGELFEEEALKIGDDPMKAFEFLRGLK